MDKLINYKDWNIWMKSQTYKHIFLRLTNATSVHHLSP